MSKNNISAVLVFSLILFGLSGQKAPAQGSPWTLMKGVPVSTALRAVSGLAWNDVWAVGDEGKILHWNGADWKIVPAGGITQADLKGLTLTKVVLLGEDDGWIVGYDSGKHGYFFRWNGTSWNYHTRMIGENSDLSGVAFADRNQGFAVSGEGQIFEWDGKSWKRVTDTILNALRETVGHVTEFNIMWNITVHPTTKAYFVPVYLQWDPGHPYFEFNDLLYLFIVFAKDEDGYHADICDYGKEDDPGFGTFVLMW